MPHIVGIVTPPVISNFSSQIPLDIPVKGPLSAKVSKSKRMKHISGEKFFRITILCNCNFPNFGHFAG